MNKNKEDEKMSGKKIQKKAKISKLQKKKAIGKPNGIKKELIVQNEMRKIKLALPRNLHDKIKTEEDPDKIVAEAVIEYYGGARRRAEISIQKEIDNNIIEVQRRHISDLKEQLNASNKNYEELMKTYQAYMLQVQPMIENAPKKEIEAEKSAAEKRNETKKSNENKNEKQESTENPVEKNTPQTPPIQKKWYEFWK